MNYFLMMYLIKSQRNALKLIWNVIDINIFLSRYKYVKAAAKKKRARFNKIIPNMNSS